MTKRTLVCCVGLVLLSAAAVFAGLVPQAAPLTAEELPLAFASCESMAASLPFPDTLPEPMPMCIPCDDEQCAAMCRERRCGGGICQSLCNQHCLCFDCRTTINF